MASKRTIGSDPVASTGSAPARAKNKGTRTHRSATAAETSEQALAASPVAEPPLPAESPVMQPALEEIAQLAYSYWEARGYQGGSPEEDWLRAEEEMRANATA
jgi:hypothetical protein